MEGTEAIISTIGPLPGKPCDPQKYEKAMQDIRYKLKSINHKKTIK
jgi:hypothetical protein